MIPLLIVLIGALVGALILFLCIWLLPLIRWLLKIDTYYTYVKYVTGLSRLQALWKVGLFIYRQAVLDATNHSLQKENERLQKKVLSLEKSLATARRKR